MLGPRLRARASSSRGKRGPPFIAVRGPPTIVASRCGAQAPDAQAQQLWPTGPAAPRHVGSSQTRARTRVPCVSRQTLNHCATREAPLCIFKELLSHPRKINIMINLEDWNTSKPKPKSTPGVVSLASFALRHGNGYVEILRFFMTIGVCVYQVWLPFASFNCCRKWKSSSPKCNGK